MNNRAESEYREKFLRNFLSMFDGVELVEITKDIPEYIEGTLSWGEDVRWYMTPDATPSNNCLEMVSFIAAKELLEIDQISISRKSMYKMIISSTENSWSDQEFESAINELLKIKVARIEDGQEIDDFFVHF